MGVTFGSPRHPHALHLKLILWALPLNHAFRKHSHMWYPFSCFPSFTWVDAASRCPLQKPLTCLCGLCFHWGAVYLRVSLADAPGSVSGHNEAWRKVNCTANSAFYERESATSPPSLSPALSCV